MKNLIRFVDQREVVKTMQTSLSTQKTELNAISIVLNSATIITSKSTDEQFIYAISIVNNKIRATRELGLSGECTKLKQEKAMIISLHKGIKTYSKDKALLAKAENLLFLYDQALTIEDRIELVKQDNAQEQL